MGLNKLNHNYSYPLEVSGVNAKGVTPKSSPASSYTLGNPVLGVGELAIETDTGKFKIGNGITPWNTLAYATDVPSVVTQINGSYTITATDAFQYFRATSAFAMTITLNNVLTQGQRIDVQQYGIGQVTFAAGTGITLYSVDSKFKTNKQYSVVSVVCTYPGYYILVGDLVA